MQVRSRHAAAIALVATLLLVGNALTASAGVGGKRTAHTAFPGTINVSYPVAGAGQFLPLQLAKSDGIFQKYGLSVNVEVVSAATTDAAIESGSIQLAVNAPPALDFAYESGIPVQLYGWWGLHQPLYLLVSPGITSISSLEGKPISTSGTTALSQILEEYLIHLAGIPYSAFSFVPTSSINQFISGEIDAYVGSILSVREGELGRPGSSALYNFDRLLWPTTEIWGYTPWTSSHKAETVAFLKAMNTAVATWNSNAALAEQVLEQYNPGISQNTAAIEYESTERVFDKGTIPLHAPTQRIQSYVNKVLRLVGFPKAVNNYSYAGHSWTGTYWTAAFARKS